MKSFAREGTMQELDTIEKSVVAAIARACSASRDCLELDTSLDEVGLDSLGLHSVINDVQERCGIELSPDQLMSFLAVTTVRDVAAVFKGLTTGEARVAP
jgi:acyl carrier protein